MIRRPGRVEHCGAVICGKRVWPVALGLAGLTAWKREGDGATPRGALPVRMILYRADRIGRPRAGLPIRAIRRADGWCDDPIDRNYNRPVRLPYPASAERLWRDDHLYDLVLVLGWNDGPRRRGRGSAIFLHVARPGYAPTEGCVAMRADHIRRLIQMRGAPLAIKIG